MQIEGVTYYRFRVRYTLTCGKRRTMIRWSPGLTWIGEQVRREFSARNIDVKARSNVVITAV